MACKLTVAILSESQEGNIGNDWKYTLEARVFSGPLTGEGSISVPKHELKSGKRQTPPGPPEPLSLNAGQAGDTIKIDLKLIATEVDLLRNDTGEHSVSIHMDCPDDGESTVTREMELSVGVTESPGNMTTAVFALDLKLELGHG